VQSRRPPAAASKEQLVSDTGISEGTSVGPHPDLPDGTYNIDPERSQLRFRAKAFALAWVRGTMPVISGCIWVRNGRVSGSGEIAADKVTTGLAPRDWHLRSSHYLGTARHPRIAVSVDDTGLDAGQFPCTVVVRDTPTTVPLDLRAVEIADGRLRIEAHIVLDRTPFPMLPPIAGVSRRVDVELTLVADQALPLSESEK
jgi:polyisoprenoid-binding protein YceI